MNSLHTPPAVTRIKLVQLSDCHLLANPLATLKMVNPLQTLQFTIEHILSKHIDASALLMTGDISQDGSSDSYQLLAKSISNLPMPVYALPGNHDNWLTMQQSTNNKLLFEKSFDLNNWRILQLHSSVPDQVAGIINPPEFSWLDAQLAASVNKHLLLATHHQPIPLGNQWLDGIGLTNSARLSEKLRDHDRVKIVLHGHTHQASHRKMLHIDCYGTPSTWRQFSSAYNYHRMDFLPPACRIIQLFADGTHSSWVEFVPNDRLPDRPHSG